MHGPDAFSRMFDADDGGSAAPRREDMILPVQAGRHQHDVDDSRTSRWHRDDDVDNELEPCRHRKILMMYATGAVDIPMRMWST